MGWRRWLRALGAVLVLAFLPFRNLPNVLRWGQLVIPLDTHIARISSYIGLTDMRSPGWPMALDITRSLRKLHCDDPLRYDFALCHLGIAGDCPKKRDLQKCARCPILAICRL